jgi:hypothetical protein
LKSLEQKKPAVPSPKCTAGIEQPRIKPLD